MTIRTLIVGYEPPSDLAALNPRDRRNAEYFSKLLGEHNLGELHYSSQENFCEKLDALDPIIVIVFDSSTAREVSEYKRDTFVYVAESPSSVFHRKTEVESRQLKNEKIFREAAGLLRQIIEEGEEKLVAARRYAAMSFQDKYDMVVQMLISDDEKIHKMGRELINRNDIDPDFIWIRVKLIADLWQNADAKGRQEFTEAAIQGHVSNGIAHQMKDFTDADGQIYKQFMFHDVHGKDVNEIRLVPVATPDMGKYDYEALFSKHETPIGSRTDLEAGIWKTERDIQMSNSNDEPTDSPLNPAEKLHKWDSAETQKSVSFVSFVFRRPRPTVLKSAYGRMIENPLEYPADGGT